jgi:hypothetical protein
MTGAEGCEMSGDGQTQRKKGLMALEQQEDEDRLEMARIALVIADKVTDYPSPARVAWDNTPDEYLYRQYHRAADRFWRSHGIVMERRAEWTNNVTR